MVQYTRHAQLQMERRKIWEAEVEEVLARHHTAYKDREGNDVYVGHPSGRRIRVVVAGDSRPPQIITAAD